MTTPIVTNALPSLSEDVLHPTPPSLAPRTYNTTLSCYTVYVLSRGPHLTSWLVSVVFQDSNFIEFLVVFQEDASGVPEVAKRWQCGVPVGQSSQVS